MSRKTLAPSQILNVPASSTPTASVTIALGDANANGKADISLEAAVFGRALPRVIVDIGWLDGLNFVTALHSKIKGIVDKLNAKHGPYAARASAALEGL